MTLHVEIREGTDQAGRTRPLIRKTLPVGATSRECTALAKALRSQAPKLVWSLRRLKRTVWVYTNQIGPTNLTEIENILTEFEDERTGLVSQQHMFG